MGHVLTDRRLGQAGAWLDKAQAHAELRKVPLPFLPGKGMLAPHFVVQFALPNFYFHATTAYAILRHNGVELGKPDYIGGIEIRDL